MNIKTSFNSMLICLMLFPAFLMAQKGSSDNLNLGTIDFPTSATGEAQKEFLTGMLALHSFWYPEARDHFKKARELDPNFAMAYWGEALTHDHPIWKQHDQYAGTNVLEVLNSRSSANMNSREEAYINAVKRLYEENATMDERRINYAEAMNEIVSKYPQDDEALALAALADMSLPSYNYNTPDPKDVVYIASRLEELYKRNPEHPGALHYLIHVYDNDTSAPMGLRAANDYASVAYSSPHAIHMPSHIYKHLEMWDKVIESNIAAWEKSVNWQQTTDRQLVDRDYHSYRWLFEAYLENNNYEKACSIINNMKILLETAENRNEETGRLTSSLNNFEEQYNSNASISCKES
ncbi:MAG: hypothetical protein KFF49_13010 [Bacteroidales bacterium]|nr:hypothetical protein [Bacteroidales bacterium]